MLMHEHKTKSNYQLLPFKSKFPLVYTKYGEVDAQFLTIKPLSMSGKSAFVARMILRNHTYLKVHKCWQILPILKTQTIKCLAIFFKKYFNFQGFYIIYIIIWRFLG